MFNPKDVRFTPAGIESLSDEDLRAAYMDLGGRAREELKKIAASKTFGEAAVLERNMDYYPPISKIDEYYNPRRELEWRTVEAAAQLRSQKGTLAGLRKMRKNLIANLQSKGYKNINSRNIEAALDWLQTRQADFFGSEQILDFFNALPQKLKISTKPEKLEDKEFESFFRSISKGVTRKYKGKQYALTRAAIRETARKEKGYIASIYYAAVKSGTDIHRYDIARKIRSDIRVSIYGKMAKTKTVRRNSRKTKKR